MGGADATPPYLVWSISRASIDTGSVQDGSVITGGDGLDVDDGAGQIMMDAPRLGQRAVRGTVPRRARSHRRRASTRRPRIRVQARGCGLRSSA